MNCSRELMSDSPKGRQLESAFETLGEGRQYESYVEI